MELSELKRRNFLVTEHEGGLRLVHPARNKYDWQPDELLFRSAIVDSGGRIVSIGWPKFFNQGESAEHDERIASALEAGEAVITHKHDGSLIIRSVLPDGTVLFRTRGSFDGGDYGEWARAVAAQKYPALLDASVYPEGSLLFEYVGAGNQIVVRYEGEDDLIFLGAAQHGPPVTYADWPALQSLAQRLKLRLVETYDWAGAQGISETLALVQDWSSAEGVVVRSGDGQTLLKLKSAWYFAQHALRWHMTYESIVRFCLDGNICDEAGLEAGLSQAGWDWEIIQTAKAHFGVYAARRDEAARLKAAAKEAVATFAAAYSGEQGDERARRKAFAMGLVGPDAPPERRALSRWAFFAYDGKEAALDAALLRGVILAPKASGSGSAR